ncbi:lipopolysaccharide biosynthesis protein [Klebsiella oxytoca]
MSSLTSLNAKKRKLTGVIWFFISSLFPAISSFIIFTIASRQISPSELGSVSLALTIIIFLTSLCGSGFGDALVQRKELTKEHVNTVLLLLFVMALFLFLFSVLIIHFIQIASFDELFRKAFMFFGVKLILDATSVIPLSLLTRKMEFKKIGIRTMSCSVGATLICIPILYLGAGVWAIVFSQITSSIVSSAILWFSLDACPRFRFNRDAFYDLSSFGIKTTLSKMVSALSIDNMILGVAGSLHTLGIYSFSRRVFSVVSDVLVGSISNISYPLYASKQDQKNELGEFFLKTTFLSTLICLPAFSGLFLLSDDIIPFMFGDKWVVAIFCIKCCCVLGFLSCIGTLQLSLIKAIGNTGWILKYQLFQQITTGILALIFAKYGANAVMLAIVIKTYAVWPYTAYFISKTLNIKISFYVRSLLKPFIATVLMILAYLTVSYLCNDFDIILKMCIEVLASFFVYVMFSVILSGKEMIKIIKVFKR